MKKHIREIVKALAEANVPVAEVFQGSKHFRITLAGCERRLFISATPSCRHAYKNAIRDGIKIFNGAL